ncbi:flavin reductase family protein [Elusimicrobiota bacterium]
MEYQEISIDKAYRLVNHGPLVLLSTVSADKKYDIAPIAWNCPVGKSPTRILLAVGREHKSRKNVKATGVFAVSIPSVMQLEIVKNTGSVSGHEVDKISRFSISCITGRQVDVKIPVGCVGYIECKVIKQFDQDKVTLIIGEALCAFVNKESFNERVMPELRSGCTLHHFGGGEFGVISPNLEE